MTILVGNYEHPNWRYLPADNPHKLQTTAMGDCWALIILNPDGGRLLAHLPSGDADQLNTGGLTAIRGLIQPRAIAGIVQGPVNQTTSQFQIELCYNKLLALPIPATRAETMPGYFEYARVNAAGEVKVFNHPAAYH